MDATKLVLICLVTWIIAVVLSFAHPYFVAPTGDGFVKGLNLIAIWMGWMVGALMFAVAALVVRFTRASELSPHMRILALTPAMTMAMAAVAMAVMFYVAG